jgi:hypothetical protein
VTLHFVAMCGAASQAIGPKSEHPLYNRSGEKAFGSTFFRQGVGTRRHTIAEHPSLPPPKKIGSRYRSSRSQSYSRPHHVVATRLKIKRYLASPGEE